MREPNLEQQAILTEVAHVHGNISPVKLWEAYLTMCDTNFEQDLYDLAKEIRDETIHDI